MKLGIYSGWPRSLKGQLIRLVAALAVPLIALQLWWGFRESQRAEEAAEAEAIALADATAMAVRQFLTQAELTLTATAGQFGRYFVSGASCEGPLRGMATILTFLTSVTTVDRDGNVVCSTSIVPQGTSASSWGWFPSVSEDPRYVEWNPIFGTLSGTWILPLVAPILSQDGQFSGAVVGSLPLLQLDQTLRGVNRDPEVLVTITNRESIVVTRSHNSEEWVGQPSPLGRMLFEPIEPGRGIARGLDNGGVDRIWGRVELANGWRVHAGLPSESILEPARATAVRQVSITLLILIVGVLIASRSYRRIASALEELTLGVPMTAEGVALPLPKGTPTEFQTVVEQFNEALQSRNRAEAAERASRERYQSIFDNAIFGLYVTADRRFLEVNPALVSMLGYDSAEALIAAGPEALYPSPSLRPKLIEEALEDDAIENVEVDWLRADGQPITVRLNGKLLRTANQEPAFEMIVQDIADEKHRESELRQTQKMEAIGRLAGGVAHDFNNLLTVIGGNAHFIETGLPADHPLRGEVEQITEATHRAMSLTSQLLAFSRQEPLGVCRVDLNEVITDMGKMLVPLIGEDLIIETRLGGEVLAISVNRGELEQIVMNLVLNARDAMPRGGRLLIETRSAEIGGRSGDGVTREGVVLSVRDGGVGMDAETRKRIFEPFYTTKPMGKGTGLGLSTVYGIVQRAKGHIDVESEPGQGTTIDIWFPHAPAGEDAEQPAKTPAEGQDRPTVGTETILVVEDEELVRKFVQHILVDAGYEVLTACNGEEALEIMEGLDTPANLVLTDVVMPRMKGPELADRLAAISPETIVLYMSGYIDNEEMSEQVLSHPHMMLQKPFSATELREQVRLGLDRHQA